MKTVAIIQARMGSTRLPGKTMMLLSDKTMIWHVIEATKHSKLIDEIVVATSTEKNNDVLIKELKKYKIDYYAGSEDDVLDRYYLCAKKFKADVIVRVTSDCPLIDPKIIDKVIQASRDQGCDYCSNRDPPTYPDGYDTEVFTFEALERAWKESDLMSEREHVTPYLWKNKNKFKNYNVEHEEDLSELRLTVDEQEDLELSRKIIEKIGKFPIYLNDVLALFKKEPELLKINKHIGRNEGYAKSIKGDKVVETQKQIVLVTGGCGFIGSNFIKMLLQKGNYHIINLDTLTYAGNIKNLKDDEDSPNYTFIKGDIRNKKDVFKAMEGCDFVVNFAAESHVDRSITDSSDFITTNINGTHLLLEAAKELGVKRFIQISTDEVYGSLSKNHPSSKEVDVLNPSSPYSSSKAAAELIAKSYYITHGLPVIIVRSSNNYGPYQYPEKIIPLFITNIIEGKKVPLMGKGENIRDWIYVEDNCEGILTVMEKGKDGEIYNIGVGNEKTNMEITKTILDKSGKDKSWIKRIPHRLGHDFRYSLDSTKINLLGWTKKYDFQEGMQKTINWYKNNKIWWKPLKDNKGGYT